MNSNRRKSWIFLAVTPIALVIGIVISELLYSGLGYQEGTTDAPIRIKLLMILVSFSIILTLPALSIMYGRRAISDGDSNGKAPIIVAGIFMASFALTNLLSLFAK